MKTLLKIFAAFVLLSILLMFGLSFFIGSAIKAGSEKFGSEITQVKIQLDEAKVSIFSGSGSLQGLTVGNPKDFSGEYAFNAEHISLDLVPSSLLGDKIVIEEILIIAPHIVFEQGSNSNNLSVIMGNISEYVGERDSSEPTEETETTKLEIRKFVLQSAKVDVRGENPMSLTLPTIILTDLGKGDEGLTGAEVAKKLFQSITDATLQEILNNPDALIKEGSNLLNKFFDKKEKDPEN